MTSEAHWFAELFPTMTTRPEYEDLKRSIRRSGLDRPIAVKRQGLIMEGRACYRACMATGREPWYSVWDLSPYDEPFMTTFVKLGGMI